MRELLKTCAQLERAVSDLYFTFRDIYSEDAALTSLWEKTAQEELNHEQQFLMAERLYAAQLTPDESVSLEMLQRLQQSVMALHRKVQETAPTALQALKMAVSLEEQLVEMHMKAVMRFNDQSVNKLFAAMMAADQDHVSSLSRYLAEHASP